MMKTEARGNVWNSGVGIAVFLHAIAVDSFGHIISLVWSGIVEGTTTLKLLTSFASLTTTSFISLVAFCVVVVADGIFLGRLWRQAEKVPDLEQSDARPTAVPRLAASREGQAEIPAASVVRRALWAILGLAIVALGGTAVSWFETFRDALRDWSGQINMGVAVIAAALILSALILSSVLLLISRLDAVSASGRDADETRDHLHQADSHLAVIARHRRLPDRIG